ncbi:MAG: tetratricopeptide repeat protein [Pyrinomonadaceae bacterium]
MNRFIFIIAALLFFSTVSVNAQKPDSLTAQTNAQSQDIKEAEQLSAQVVQLYKSGKFDEALSLAERALALREKALGSESELVAAALRNLAEVQLAKKKTKEAEGTYDRYLSVLEKALGETNSNLIGALDRYVCLLVNINKRPKALEIQRRLYKLDNKFDFDDTVKTPVKSLEMAGLMIGKIVNMPKPDYLAEAKIAGVTGSVVFKVTVDEKGKVVAVKALCGHPLLVKGAESSIQKAQYKPTIVSSHPVKVTGFAIYNFVL